jgi:hypothetical protein
MQEYKPGMSVADMQQTMEVLPEAASTATMLPATTGVASVPGISLASGLRRPPPKAIGGYHETWALDDFSKFKPSDHDLGTHFAVDPMAPRAADYAQLWRMNHPHETLPVKPRTVPVVADIQKSLKFPVDVGNWMNADSLIGGMEEAIKGGSTIPLQLYRDTLRAEKEAGGIAKNFVPMLQEKGFDSLYYPHISERYMGEAPKYNTFMALDPKQVMPKFSEEGQELIKQRGYHEPMKTFLNDPYARSPDDKYSVADVTQERWAIPKGILHPYAENVPDQKKVFKIEEAKRWKDIADESKAQQDQIDLLRELHNQGQVSGKEFIETYNKIVGDDKAWQKVFGDKMPKKTQDLPASSSYAYKAPKKEVPHEIQAYEDFKSGKMSQEEYLASFDKAYNIKQKSDDAKKMELLKSLVPDSLEFQLKNKLITQSEFNEAIGPSKLKWSVPYNPAESPVINWTKPASEEHIKKWGLKIGSTVKDVYDAITKWANKTGAKPNN